MKDELASTAKDANVLNGSAHFSSKVSQARLRCLIHMRVERTPGRRWLRFEERSSPITVGMADG